MATTHGSPGERIVAGVVVIWAAGWFVYSRSAAPDDQFVQLVAGIVGVVGLAVAVTVWQARRAAARLYAAWAIAAVLALVLLDARSESPWWKVALGALLAAAVLGAFGFGLAACRRRRLRSP